MLFSNGDNFLCVAPIWVNDMSNCSWRHVLHFIPLCHACLRSSRCLNICWKSASRYKLLFVVIFMPSLHSDNLVLVYPNDANDMSTCSSCHELRVACDRLHGRFIIALLSSLQSAMFIWCVFTCYEMPSCWARCYRCVYLHDACLCVSESPSCVLWWGAYHLPCLVSRWLKHALLYAMMILLF